jgi:chromosome segregation ATPase
MSPMSEGNGADIRAVYQLLREVARTVDGHTQILREHSQILREHSQILSEHSQRFREIDKRLDDLTAGLGTLREAVAHYHSSVLGHGVLISELDERVRRIERHLNLSPAG